MDRRAVEQAAREAGPWTDEAAEAIQSLRELSQRTEAETDALRVLRQREITEAIRLRREVATAREP